MALSTFVPKSSVGRLNGATPDLAHSGCTGLTNTPIPTGYPKELDVLLLCATTDLNAPAKHRLNELLAENIDWDVTLRLATRHGTMPLLHKHVAAVGLDRIPPPASEDLRVGARAKARQNVVLASELLKVKQLFDSSGIDFIPLKGPCLGIDSYGSLSFRVFGDIDLLVSEIEAPRAQAALLDAGYRPEPRNRKLSKPFMHSPLFRRLTPEQSFSRGELNDGYPPFVIDLHWQLEPPYMAPLEFSTLLANTVQIDLCGQSIRKMKAELELVYLCVHAAKHQWREIRWLVDIHQMIQKHQDLKWNSLYDLARSAGAERKVDLGLALCRSAFNTDLRGIPQSKKHEIESNELLKKIVSVTKDEWSWRVPRKDTLRYSWWYAASVADNPRQSLAIVLRELFFPNVPTYERCPLPSQLFRLYHVVHPALLLISFVAARMPSLWARRMNEAQ